MRRTYFIPVLLWPVIALSFGCAGLTTYVDPNHLPVAQPLELVIAHTNDTHSYLAGMDKYGSACMDDADCVGGAGRLATAIRSLSLGADNVLVLDAGDQFQGTLFYTVNKGTMLADIARDLGYDAMTLGNHEFDDGCAKLAEFIQALNFPVLAANIEPGETCPLRGLEQLKPFMIRNVRGQQVGIIGLANPEAPVLASPCADMQFNDSTEALRIMVARLEMLGVKYIIVLSHLGLDVDRELARTVDGVDVIVGGHTHNWLADSPEADGPYPLVETSPSGQPVLVVTTKYGTEYLGDLRVGFDPQGIPATWSGKALRLDQALPPDPAVSAKVAGYAAQLEVFRATVLGEHSLDYADGKQACRSGDCLSGMLITDAMLDYGRAFGADAAVFNGGGVRAALAPGNMTQGDLLTVMPYGNTMLIREYTGATVLDMLEHGLSGEDGCATIFGPRLLQVSGLRYGYDESRPVGQRLLFAEFDDQFGKSRPLDKNADYRIVLLDFMAKGGDAFSMLDAGTVITAPDPLDVDLFGAWVQAYSPLPMPRLGRIVNLTVGE